LQKRGLDRDWCFFYLGLTIMKPWAKSFYKGKAWRQCRDAFFISRHGLCERCSGPGKIVHHKIYLTPDNINDPSISLNFDNLELLCQDCHNKEHHGRKATRDDVMFDSDGDLIQVGDD
jgi:5-methylcytosine-specific restriction enzyme A